jgi:predicted O-methyltransferase YrrM
MKVALAAQFFDHAVGLEYDPAYAGAARRALASMSANRCEIIEGDALEFDQYGNYDVVFLYQPIQDNDRLRQLEARILTQVAAGTVILAPYDFDGAHWETTTPLARSVHVAGIDAKQARALARQVARIGPHVASPDIPIPEAAGWLMPLWRACLANGYDPAAWR